MLHVIGTLQINTLFNAGIREIKVCKKCSKVNSYCDAIFDPIMFKPFLDGAKLPKYCAKYWSLSKMMTLMTMMTVMTVMTMMMAIFLNQQ